MTLSKGATGLMLIIIYILLKNKFFDNVPFQKSPLIPYQDSSSSRKCVLVLFKWFK